MEGLCAPKTPSEGEVGSSLELPLSASSRFKQAHSEQLRPKPELAECEWYLSPDRPKSRPKSKREDLKLHCPEACCGLLFASIQDVVAHVRAHTLCCPVCSGRFDGVESLVRHVEAQHGSPRITEREFVEVFIEGVGRLQD